MTLENYKVAANPDSTHYIMQNIHKLDKNHREDYTRMVNEGKIYPYPGLYISFTKFLLSNFSSEVKFSNLNNLYPQTT